MTAPDDVRAAERAVIAAARALVVAYHGRGAHYQQIFDIERALKALDRARSSSPEPSVEEALTEERVREIAQETIDAQRYEPISMEQVENFEQADLRETLTAIFKRLSALEAARASWTALEARVEDLEKWRDAAHPVQIAPPTTQPGSSAPPPASATPTAEDGSEAKARARVELAIEKGRLAGRKAGSAGWSRMDSYTVEALVEEMNDHGQAEYDAGQDAARKDECPERGGLLACAADWSAGGHSFADWIEHAKRRHECSHRKVESAARADERRKTIEECAELCAITWQSAPNTRPSYAQNTIGPGCLASQRAILALLSPPPSAGKEGE